MLFRSLMSTSPYIVHSTDSTFDKDVLQSDVPVIVDFWAVWCGPCRAIAPHLEAMANEQNGRLRIVKVDVDSNQGTAMKYGVRSIPTLLLVKGGKVLGQQVGGLSRSALDKFVAPAL